MGGANGLAGTVASGEGVGVRLAVFLVLRDGFLVDKGNSLIGWGMEGRNG